MPTATQTGSLRQQPESTATATHRGFSDVLWLDSISTHVQPLFTSDTLGKTQRSRYPDANHRHQKWSSSAVTDNKRCLTARIRGYSDCPIYTRQSRVPGTCFPLHNGTARSSVTTRVQLLEVQNTFPFESATVLFRELYRSHCCSDDVNINPSCCCCSALASRLQSSH